MLLDKLFQSVEQSFEKAGKAVSDAAEAKGQDAMDELMDKLKVRFLNHLG